MSYLMERAIVFNLAQVCRVVELKAPGSPSRPSPQVAVGELVVKSLEQNKLRCWQKFWNTLLRLGEWSFADFPI